MHRFSNAARPCSSARQQPYVLVLYAPLAGMHDELISDILGGADPLSFGFSAKSDTSQSLELAPTVGSGVRPTGLGGASPSGQQLGASCAAGAALQAVLMSRSSSGESPGHPSAAKRSSQRAAQPQHHPHHATPAVLKKFRNSAVWSTLTHGVNYDVHQVRPDRSHFSCTAHMAQLCASCQCLLSCLLGFLAF